MKLDCSPLRGCKNQTEIIRSRFHDTLVAIQGLLFKSRGSLSISVVWRHRRVKFLG